MEYQAQQINSFLGDYGKFSLAVVTQNGEKYDFTSEKDETVHIRLVYSGYEDWSCRFYFGSDDGIYIHGDTCDISRGNGVSTVFVRLDTSREGLFFFHFELELGGRLLFLSPDGLCDSFLGEWQFLVYKNRYPTEHGFCGGAIYHIFVDRFAKGGKTVCRPDAKMLSWETDTPEYPKNQGDFLPNNTFFGGTLWGVAEKIDYIASLGVDVIYLSPVFTAYSNHKYDTGDYMQVDSMFGGDEALLDVIKKAHKKNIKVILDGVFNHVGDDSVYFDSKNKYGGAYRNPSSPYREWFNIDTDGGYECWWGIKNLPKVIKCSSFRSYICDTVIPKYMNMGIDGWRLDVVDEYSHDFLEQIVSSTKKINPNAFVLGEVWEDATNKTAYGERKRYFCGASLDAVMNYPFRNAVIDFVSTGDNTFITSVTTQIASHYPPHSLNNCMNMLGTHDTERIMTVLGGQSADGLSNDELATLKMTGEQYQKARKLFMAAYLLITALPGKTSVYYGDEAGMEGYADPFNRRPFPWNSIDGEILEFVKMANSIKKRFTPLQNGRFYPVFAGNGVFAFKRIGDDGTVSCVCNMRSESFTLPFESYSLTKNKKIKDIEGGYTDVFEGDIFEKQS